MNAILAIIAWIAFCGAVFGALYLALNRGRKPPRRPTPHLDYWLAHNQTEKP